MGVKARLVQKEHLTIVEVRMRKAFWFFGFYFTRNQWVQVRQSKDADMAVRYFKTISEKANPNE